MTVTESCGNVFKDLGFDDKEAAVLLRDAVLDEAARVCDAEWIGTGSLCRSKCAGDLAKAIRALKRRHD
jgi:hypothetical protein